MFLRTYFEHCVGCMAQTLAGFLAVSASLVCVVVGELVVLFKGHKMLFFLLILSIK